MNSEMNYPKIVEFAGLPRSGKTTAASGLKRFLESEGSKVYLVKERASLCPIPGKLHPDFNLWTSLSFLREFLIARNTGCHYVIADRGIFDASIWIKLFCSEQKHAEEYRAFQKLEKLDFLTRVPKKIFFFYCEIDVALEREFERTLVSRDGKIMNKEVLGKYLHTYLSMKGATETECVEIDTTNLPISKMLSCVYAHFDQS